MRKITLNIKTRLKVPSVHLQTCFLLSCIVVLMNHGLLCIIQTIPVGAAATAAANASVPRFSKHLITSVIAAVLLVSDDVVHTLKGSEDILSGRFYFKGFSKELIFLLLENLFLIIVFSQLHKLLF